MSAITAKASRKMKKYAVLTREPRCFLGSFDFSWEQRKLTEFVEFFSGLTYTPNDVQENGTLVLRSSNVSNGEVVDADNIYVNPQVVNSENVKVGDIVVVVRNGSRSLIGKHAQIKAFMPNTVIGAFMTDIRSECPEFTNALLNTSRFEEEIAMNMGATINQITGYMFSKMEFKVPCLDEQKKIGEYFEKLDNLITLHQRKCVFLFGFFQAFISMIFTASTFSWEQRKLTEFVEFFSGLTYTPNDVQENGTLVLRSSNVSNGEVVDADNIYVNPQVVNSENVKVGDIVVVVRNGSRSLIGKHAQIKAFMPNTVIGAFMTDIRSECPEFTNALLNTSRFEEEIAMNMGATINQITGYMFSKMEFKVPCLDEQKKIGEYFEKLDNLITLHQRECISFTARAGRLILTANKKRNTSSWEQRKLGEMGQTYTGLSGKTKDDFGHGQARFVTYMNVFSNPISNPEMTEPIEIDPKQNEVEVGDVFFTTSSETPEEVGMSSILLEKRGKTYLNSFCFGFRPSEKLDSYYLAYMLRSESTRAKIILLAQGISRYNISKNKVMEIAVSLPSLDEQKMIGQYFSQLDNLITLHQRKPFLMKWRTSDANRNQTNRLVL